MRRKLVFGTGSFILGILTFYISPILFFFCLLFLLLSVYNDNNRCLWKFLLILFFLVGGGRLYLSDMMINNTSLTEHIGQPYTCYGRVLNIKNFEDGKVEILCKVDNRNVLCYYRGKEDCFYNLIGRKILFTLHLKPVQENLYLKGRNIGYSSSIYGFQLGEIHSGIYIQFKRMVQNKQRNFIKKFITFVDEKNFLNSILFGNISSLNEKIYQNFRENGTAHILAVSGLHIGIIYGIYSTIEKKIKIQILPFLFFSILFIYGTAANWSVFVLRATIMIVVLVVGNAFDRRYDMLTTCVFSSLLLLLYNPFFLFSVGFQMSFLAVISIAFLMPLFSGYIGSFFSLIISVQIGMMPYMLYCFGQYTFKGIICNMPTVFLAGILVPAGVFYFILYFLFSTEFKFLDYFLVNISMLIMKINKFFANYDFLQCRVIFDSLFYIFLFYFVIFFVSSESFTIHRKRREYVLLLKIFLYLCIASWFLSYGISLRT